MSDAKEPVGYLIQKETAAEGKPGVGMSYRLAGNGLFLEASNHLLRARLPLYQGPVRGLRDCRANALRLPQGHIPAVLFECGLEWMRMTPGEERMFAIVHREGEYRLEMPAQLGTSASCKYRPVEGAVAEFHSHGVMGAFFSPTDDRDEQGFRIYGVAGHLDRKKPAVTARLGIYGTFGPAPWNEIFDRPTPHATLVETE